MKKRCIITALAVSMLLFSADVTVRAAEKSIDEETFEEILNYAKEKMDAGELDTKEEIRKAIEEAEKEFGVNLPASAEELIVNGGIMVQKLGLDSETLAKKAEELYNTYGDSVVEELEGILEGELSEKGAELKEQLVESGREAATEAVKSPAKNFFSDLMNSVVGFVKNIFHKS